MNHSGTALSFVPALAHTLRSHPENHRRVQGLLSFFDREGILQSLRRVDVRPADAGLLGQVHSKGLLEELRRACLNGVGRMDADTYIVPESYELARMAAGGCCALVDAVYSGGMRNGLAVVRPPGHHAQRDSVGGFCLINNVAVAAKYAQIAHRLRRVLIVDFDVHHGNGTQDIFYSDPDVLFISLHLYHPFFFPGTGGIDEIGRGQGRGTTVNVPFPPEVGDLGYARVLKEVVAPRARSFEPELVLVSAGFDAHWRDPLARALLTLEGYAEICKQLNVLADGLCNGRIIYVLEGGYDREALHHGLLNLVQGLLGHDNVQDPLGSAPGRERDVTNLLVQLQKLHLLN